MVGFIFNAIFIVLIGDFGADVAKFRFVLVVNVKAISATLVGVATVFDVSAEKLR